MYGLVNQAIRDLVVTRFGDQAWTEICQEAKSPTTEFVGMQYYSDDITYGLVMAAAKHLNLPPETVLAEFGKYWILFTAKEGYGPLMDLFGKDFPTSLANLNNLHARMGMTLPHLTPPRFDFKKVSDHEFLVEYQSKRAGLSPMVLGLLEGLAARYNVKAKIEHIAKDGNQTFKVTVEA